MKCALESSHPTLQPVSAGIDLARKPPALFAAFSVFHVHVRCLKMRLLLLTTALLLAATGSVAHRAPVLARRHPEGADQVRKQSGASAAEGWAPLSKLGFPAADACTCTSWYRFHVPTSTRLPALQS